MSRRPNHRGGYLGRDERPKRYHLSKLFCLVAASRDLAAGMRPASARGGFYEISPALVLRWKATLGDALPYLEDDEGRVKF